jgi:type IV pilus assembly protein PilA
MAIVSKIRKSRGFTLVELMIVVVIIGILAALAIYGVRKYVANSKSAEARLAIGAINKGAVAAFEGETMAGSLLALGGTVGSARRLCATSDAVPAIATIAGGKKYQSSDADWSTAGANNSQTAGWLCLKFSLTGPQYYSYLYTATNPTSATGSYTVTATADMDNDSTNAVFTLNAAIENNTLKVSPSIIETNPDE